MSWISYNDEERADQDRAVLYARIKELEEELKACTDAKPPNVECNDGLSLVDAADAVMAHQWSNTRAAMDALAQLVDTAYAHANAVAVAIEREREECAKVCDGIAYQRRGANSQIVECATAIRARSNV